MASAPASLALAGWFMAALVLMLAGCRLEHEPNDKPADGGMDNVLVPDANSTDTATDVSRDGDTPDRQSDGSPEAPAPSDATADDTGDAPSDGEHADSSPPDSGTGDAPGATDGSAFDGAPGDGASADATFLDADGDTISDDDEGRPQNVDTDGDATPDWQDTDSDGDGALPDRDEAGDANLATPPIDSDRDGTPNFRDLDSDNDCRHDALELGDHDRDGLDSSADLDSDDDGISDQSEDADCDGELDVAETHAFNEDTDYDSETDLMEIAVGTDPQDPDDNSRVNGDIVFLVPFQRETTPLEYRVSFVAKLGTVDLYVILDRSASMSAEITTIRNDLAAVVQNLSCPPRGTGDPLTCISDLWAGVGTVGYSAAGGDAYVNHVDLQPNANFSPIPTTEPSGCCMEPLTFSLFATITGQGSAAAVGCGLTGVSSRTSCAGSPAASAGYAAYGYPCFRQGALPLIALVTDEPPLSPGDTHKCPDWSTSVGPQLLAHGARQIGIFGSGASAAVIADLENMARDTSAVDARKFNAPPVVVAGADANSATAIENAVRTAANAIPVDLVVALEDDPTDGVDAIESFVDHVETVQGFVQGAPPCAAGLADIDTSGDGRRDTYRAVPAGTPVCWNLTPKNTTVAVSARPQVFRGTIRLMADWFVTLETRDIYFIVPPLIN